MPEASGALTPQEAALASMNAYYTLQGWAAFESTKVNPRAGMESSRAGSHEIVGSGTYSLGQAGVSARGKMFNATTGNGTLSSGVSSGFGYVVEFKNKGKTHAIVATRGTRPELGKADLLTDVYVMPSARFMDAGLVHRGFSQTFESSKDALDSGPIEAMFDRATYIHCCGHSLGGAIANLNAYYLHKKYPGKQTFLYTFGAPRVGTYVGLARALEQALGNNIYRVSHHMDPVTMIPCFPFVHVMGDDSNRHCINIPSPNNKMPAMENHDMTNYLKTMVKAGNWEAVINLKHRASFEDRMMSDAMASGGFKGAGKKAGAAVVWVIMKVLKGLLKLLGGAIITLVATPLDLILRVLTWGAQELGKLGTKIGSAMMDLGRALGLAITSAANATSEWLRTVADRLGQMIRQAGSDALDGNSQMGAAYAQIPGVGIYGMYPM